jgi:hypothetical protein
MDPTEFYVDEQGEPHCSACGSRPVETSRHASHFDQRNGKYLGIDRVWGRCEKCHAEGWWRTERRDPDPARSKIRG